MSLISDQMFAVMLECVFSKKISLHIISKAIGEDLNTAKYVANKMRELFPEGRKPGTTYYWRDSTPIIAKKLKTVVEKFNTQFTEEQALDATRRYVESFNGDYRFMQLLKYFILKTDRATGDIRSDFLSLLQNPDAEDSLNDNWLNEVR